jgi:CspA family cold shock protein
MEIYKGKIKWFNPDKGYGFIEREDGGKDLLIHFSSIVGGGYRSLDKGQQVEFKINDGVKGLQAVDVTVIN